MATNLTRRREAREPTGTLSRWEPLRTLRDLDPLGIMREMLRWDPLSDWEPLAGPDLSFVPRTNVQEKADAYMITMELPGIRPDAIEISVSGNRLTVSGEIQQEARDEGDRYHAFERVYGRFSRSFTLPEGVDPNRVRAEINNGVLSVTIPKQPGVEAKRIPVEASKGTEEQQPSERQVKVDKADMTDRPDKAAA